jgi:L-lactate dehydrogenase complex protein LldG
MSARDQILGRVRAALGNPRAPEAAPTVMLAVPPVGAEERLTQFKIALEKLAGHVHTARDESDAAEIIRTVVENRSVYSTHPLIASSTSDVSAAEVGVTGAAYALADTGSLVMLSSGEERLASLLPPVHISVLKREQILTTLDELFTLLPQPANQNASMVVITGPSRTADIEQILVRGVHGPGELHVVLI